MAYQLWWAVPNRVVMQRCYGELTIEELRQNNIEFVTEYLQAGTPLVHTIIDLTEVTNFPKNLLHLSQAFKRAPEDLERLGWTLVIGANPVIKFFASIITQLWSQARFRMFNTVDEAQQFLKEQAKDIDFSTWNSTMEAYH